MRIQFFTIYQFTEPYLFYPAKLLYASRKGKLFKNYYAS